MIPKTIHYCWLSNDPVPPDYAKYVDSWHSKLSGYEFLLWDTKRFDINSTLWTKQAFELQIYASVCDYIRLYAVYNYGGIYLDMDMEVLRPFDNFVQKDLMIAYENHISENIEAGCFGASEKHPYIRKCMEYLEGRNFCDPASLPHILTMEKSERHDFIKPPILPEIMRIVLQESFSSAKYQILSHDYFTAKNIVTGEIETTANTVTIHHFASQYHSEEWRKLRAWEQRVKLRFGEKNFLSEIICGVAKINWWIKKLGVLGALKYYFAKYVSKRGYR
jgi:mannosyltransferase OCH1-like enzyme